MKIAVWHNLPSGGGKRALYHHLKGLHQRGHTLHTWSPPRASDDFLPLSAFTAESVVPCTFPTQRKPASRIGQSAWKLRTAVARLEAFERHGEACAAQMAGGGFDVLFANACTWYRTSYVGLKSDLPSALYLQEPYRWLYEALPELPWPAIPAPGRTWRSPGYLAWFVQDVLETQALRIQAREERAMAAGFDRILVNSLFSRESVRRAYGLDSSVCYLGVDTDLFRPLRLPRERLVVSVGGLYVGKGADVAIRAVAAVPARMRPRLLWIGNFADPDLLRDLQALAGSLSVDFVCKVLIPDEELVQWLNRAAALLYTPRLEPFGFAPLEAMACETPSVALAEGGIRETVQHEVTGLLADNCEPGPLAAALTRLLEDPGLARTLGAEGLRQVQARWTWTAALDRLEQHLLNLARLGKNA